MNFWGFPHENDIRTEGNGRKRWRFRFADTLRYATSKDSLETSEILADALARLTDSERETVVLKAVDGLTHREIASLTGCSVDTAKRTYYRGIQKLKRYMKGE